MVYVFFDVYHGSFKSYNLFYFSKQMTTRTLQKGRKYKGQIAVFRYLFCAAAFMIINSFLLTLLGFYWLINSHVDQAVRMSKIKNLQILANSLAELTGNKLSVIGSDLWKYANTMTEYNRNPNINFQLGLKTNESVFVQDDDGNTIRDFISGSRNDLFNNQFQEDGKDYCDKVEQSDSIGNDDLALNIEKIGWYISTKPLPDLIAYDPDVQHDLTACSAKAAMFSIPLNRVTTDVESEYAYIEYLFTGFGASAIMCMSPLNYQSMYHKSLSITGYSCLVDDLPFDEFPGWDDPLTYSPVCR